jgi:flagellar assembly factor FliW
MASLTIESTRFGTVEIDDAIVLTLEQGMIGFPDHRRYAILKQREDSVFMWLHSVEDPSLAFPIVLPWVFYWDYEVDLSDADMAAIGVERADQISIYCVVNVGADVRAATINLFSPIVVNNGDRRARQVINTIDGYSTRDQLFRETDSPTPVAMHESDAPNVTVLTTGG